MMKLLDEPQNIIESLCETFDRFGCNSCVACGTISFRTLRASMQIGS